MSKFPASLFPVLVADGATEFRYLGLVPYAQNELLAVFSQALIIDQFQGFSSADNPANWVITPQDPRIPAGPPADTYEVPEDTGVPTYLPEVAEIEADEVDPRQLRVRFNVPLEPRVIYELTISDTVRGADCRKIADSPSRSTKALFRGKPIAPRLVNDDLQRDWAMEFFPVDPNQPASTWRLDSSTDIGIQDSTASLKKRIIRHILSSPGSFKHLGLEYGINIGVKQLGRSGELQRAANRIAEKVREEPDVREASVQARIEFGADGNIVARYHVRALFLDRQEAIFSIGLPG